MMVECGVRAAIDISDGLISDLGHICRESRVGAWIEIDHVPIHPSVRENFKDRAIELALTGGEDYELLFTASTKIIERAKAAVSCPVTVIGEITAEKAGEVVLVDDKGNEMEPPGKGWEHFTAEGSN